MKEEISRAIWTIPKVEGPVPVMEPSHPFCAMKYSRSGLDLASYGFVEKEFFLSGYANVYDEDDSVGTYIKRAPLPYKNRILVRRPADIQRFSGRVYMDILNASNGYDVEDFWLRGYRWCLEHGHAYVGVTTKPVCALSLKHFDYARYESLDWSSGESVPQPAAVHPVCASIPGTEEGLVWDILSQTASLLRYGREDNCLGGYPVERLYLTGQSQSGAYINTYVNHFDEYLVGRDGKRLYDGYMNMVGVQLERLLCQEIGETFFNFRARRVRPVRTPFISVTSEGDLNLHKTIISGDLAGMTPPDSDTAENKSRHYEIAGAPHSDISVPVLPSDAEIAKTGRPVARPGSGPVNEMPLAYYIVGLLEKLHIWAAEGRSPEMARPIEKDAEGLPLRDGNGNAIGGLRSPFLDVPAARYCGYGVTPMERVTGTMEYFSYDKMSALYKTKQEYLERFSAYTDMQAEKGWITASDGERMKAWSRETAARYWR